jgi:hypothetical protein
MISVIDAENFFINLKSDKVVDEENVKAKPKRVLRPRKKKENH